MWLYRLKPHKITTFSLENGKIVYKKSKLMDFVALLAILSYTRPSSAKRWRLCIAALQTDIYGP
jgi:hypothetical protein